MTFKIFYIMHTVNKTTVIRLSLRGVTISLANGGPIRYIYLAVKMIITFYTSLERSFNVDYEIFLCPDEISHKNKMVAIIVQFLIENVIKYSFVHCFRDLENYTF